MLNKLADHFKYTVASRLTGDHSAPFHWLVNESWNKEFFKEYRRAQAFDKKVDKSNLRMIRILSYSCSGTHSFYTHFHYMPVAFSMGENTFIDKKNDPHQFRAHPRMIKPAHWLFGSAFNEQGLQNKKGNELTHLFLLSNHYLKFPDPVLMNGIGENDRILFYQRNFIRVLYSQDRDSRKYNKSHFALTDERFVEVVKSHRRRLAEMVEVTKQNPEKASFCFHENFCAAPQRVMAEVCDFIEIEPGERKGWDTPETFFTQCYRTGLAPELRDQILHCPTTQKPIYGKGGQYNPIPPISLERTISAPIRDWLSADRRKILTQTFGNDLVDFWLNDDVFDYANATTEELSEMIAGITEG